MKLKVIKAFQSIEVDADDELFPNGIFEFNITKLAAHLKSNEKDFPIKNVAVKTLGLTSSNLDEAAIRNANLANPIILAEIAPGRFNVVDGNHRVEKARRDGVESIPAYRIPPAVYHRFLTSLEAYTEHVAYWNEKVEKALNAPDFLLP